MQDCADFRISLQRSYFGIKISAEQNHDLARRRFRLGDQGKLLGSQSQAALRHVSALSGGTSDDHKRGIRLRTFGDDVQAVKCKRLLDGRGVGQVRGVHAAAAMGQGLHEAAASQHQYSTILHRQRIVFIFQQDRTFQADLPNQRRFGLILFLQGIVPSLYTIISKGLWTEWGFMKSDFMIYATHILCSLYRMEWSTKPCLIIWGMQQWPLPWMFMDMCLKQ